MTSSPPLNQIVMQPSEYVKKFDPDAYLEFYFSKKAIEDGTRISLFALPVFAHLMIQTMRQNERETLLDIGAGPTVYSALCFRDVARQIHLSDFVDRNLDVLRKWIRHEETIDWQPTIRVIKRTEGGQIPTDQVCNEIEEKTRGLVKSGGIHFADVHQSVVVPELAEIKVDILVSIFTLESACKNYEEYCKCLLNMMKHLRSGGRFIIGSVLEENEYNAGTKMKHLRSGGRFIIGSVLEENEYNAGTKTIFHLLHLREQQIIDALIAADLDVENAKKYVVESEGVLYMMATKK